MVKAFSINNGLSDEDMHSDCSITVIITTLVLVSSRILVCCTLGTLQELFYRPTTSQRLPVPISVSRLLTAAAIADFDDKLRHGIGHGMNIRSTAPWLENALIG